MASLDTIIQDTAEKFDLGDNADLFIAEVLRFMADPAEGGLTKFLDGFRNARLGHLAASWVSRGGEKKPLSTAELESVVGTDLTDRISTTLGLDRVPVESALTYVVPKLVDLLTPDGLVPRNIPTHIRDFLGGSQANFAGLHPRTSRASTNRPVEPVSRPRPDRVLHQDQRVSDVRPVDAGYRLSPWEWLAIALWSALLAYWALIFPGEAVVTKPAVMLPKASTPARLSLSNVGGRVEYSGVVADERTQTRVLDALRSAFGAENLAGNLTIDPKVVPAQWLDKLKAVLEQFNIPGADILLEGDRIKVGGWLPDLDRTRLLESLRSILGPNFTFELLGDKVSDAVKASADKTLAALNTLKPGYTGADVVNALNFWVINFATDSAEIPAESRELVSRAAQAIKAAPAGTMIEISGHTDNTGNLAANLTLSQKRADSVRNALINAGVVGAALHTKGYGSNRPVANNDTPDGRFRNRRIEFSLMK